MIDITLDEFVGKYFGIKLYPYQIEILRKLENVRRSKKVTKTQPRHRPRCRVCKALLREITPPYEIVKHYGSSTVFFKCSKLKCGKRYMVNFEGKVIPI